MSVRATNETGNPVRPQFALNSTGQLSSYWTIASGPTVLAAGRTALYSLSSPNLQTSPSLTMPFVISAVSASPDAVSTSQVFQAVDRILVLTPREVDNPLRVGRTIVFQAQIENSVGIPLPVAGVRVGLMQRVLGESHHFQPTASLNGQPATNPVAYARTNAQGVATFRVRDMVPTGTRSAPLFLRAWIPVIHSYPYGYFEHGRGEVVRTIVAGPVTHRGRRPGREPPQTAAPTRRPGRRIRLGILRRPRQDSDLRPTA